MGSLRTLLALLAATSIAAADLTLEFELEAGGEKHQTRMRMSGGCIRFDAANASTIVLPAERRTVMLFHGTRTFSNLQQEDALGALAEVAAATATPGGAAPPRVTRTGAKTLVSGLECEQVVLADADGTREELWLSPAAPSLALVRGEGRDRALTRFGMGLAERWQRWLGTQPSLATVPVRSVLYDAASNVVCSTTLAAFSTNAIAEEQFQVPAGYAPAELPLFALPAGGDQMQQLESQTQEMEDAVRRLGDELKNLEKQRP